MQGVAEGSRLSFTGLGSLMGLHFTEDGAEEIFSVGDFKGKERTDLRDLFWFEMLEEGFWITRRGFVALNLETLDEDLDRFVDSVSIFLHRHAAIMKL